MLNQRKLSQDSSSARYRSMGHQQPHHQVSGSKEKVTQRLSSWISSSIHKAKTQLPKYRSRRASKCFDHGKIVRDLLSAMTTRDLIQLVDEYHCSSVLKELSFHAESARPSASTVSADLTDLFDSRHVPDTFLVFRGIQFPVHKSLICVRSPFFRELLGKVNVFGSRVPVHISDPNVRPEMLNDVLRFLYSGHLLPSQNSGVIDGLTGTASRSSAASYESTLIRLSEQLSGPRDLDSDLKHLLETGLYSDASLVFSGHPPAVSQSSATGTTTATMMRTTCRACSDQNEFSCHSAVLAARSVFFRNVVHRHQRRLQDESLSHGSSAGLNTANQKIRIVLDESIIPRRFARLILTSMYRHSTSELMSLLPLSVCRCTTVYCPDAPLLQQQQQHQQPQSQSQSATGSPLGQSMHSLSSTSTLVPSHSHHHNQHPAGGPMTTSTSSSLSSFASIGPSSASCAGSSNVSAGSHASGSSQSAASSPPGSYVNEIMDLYEIARFLELDSLIQTCEDLMIESLTIETLVPILRWSEQPHGSPWVKRQAITFLREEFSAVAASPVLVTLDPGHLMDTIRSDFLQSSELEVLQAVIKWGEHRLVRRMEEREPNVVSQTAHSLRRGVRKRDLNDSELRDLISEFMTHVRIPHILPLDSEVLMSAVKRGLIPHLPPCVLRNDHSDHQSSSDTQSQLMLMMTTGVKSQNSSTCASDYWIRSKFPGPYSPFCPGFRVPRLFSPYVEEAKSYLEDRLKKPADGIRVRSHSQAAPSSSSCQNTSTSLLDYNHHFFLPGQQPASSTSQTLHHRSNGRSLTPGAHSSRSGSQSGSSHVPDTLYMVDSNNRSQSIADFANLTSCAASEIYGAGGSRTNTCCSPAPPLSCFETGDDVTPSDLLSVVDSVHESMHGANGPVVSSLPVIEQRILVLMKQREQELKSSSSVSLSSVPQSRRSQVTRLIQLRVVREFGLPDAAAEVLHNTCNYVPYPATETTESANDDTTTASYGVVGMAPSSGVLSNVGSNGALHSDSYSCCPPSDPRPGVSGTSQAGVKHLVHQSSHHQHQSLPSCSPVPPHVQPMTGISERAASESFLQFSFEDEYLGGKLMTSRMETTMPDIALATSALAEMHLFRRSTESLAQQPPPPQRPFDPSAPSSSRLNHFLP